MRILASALLRAVVASSIVLALPAPAAVAPATRLKALSDSGLTVATNRKTGQAVFVGTGSNGPTAVQSLTGASGTTLRAGDEPNAVMAALAPAFGIADAASQTRLTRDRVDATGRMARYRQLHRGLPVIGGEMIVNLDASGRFIAMAGRAAPELVLDTIPTLTPQEALDAAVRLVARDYAYPQDKLTASVPELSVLDPRLLEGVSGSAASLVYRVEVKAIGLDPIRMYMLIDAHEGYARLQFNQIHTARNRMTYAMPGTRSDAFPGTLLCNEGNDACTGAIADGVFAHVYARDTYDYYFSVHGRDSIDDAGMTIISSVNYCPADTSQTCPYQNAFWNGTQMVYGPNFAAGDDVVGHEITHGVTERESGLFYWFQSGAINESLSDVFGEFIDQQNGKGNDSPAVMWLMGEDLSIGAIRSMKDPTLFSDPDRMTGGLYYTGAVDNGGVHTNSGLNNKAAYLMAAGGTFNGRTIAALGNVKTAKIYYRTNANYLSSASDYFDLYNLLFQSCLDLVGTSGITVGDCKGVRDATEAVEMHLQPIANFNTDAPMCAVGSAVSSIVLSENIDSSLANWTQASTNTATQKIQWGYADGYATSGIRSLFGPDRGTTATATTNIADMYIAMINPVVVPAGGQFRFRHAWGFDSNSTLTTFYDGGVLEYTINGGTSWVDANSLRVDGPGYGGTLQTAFSNPLGGRSAFVGFSHGYVATRYDLSSLAGQSIRFRWRMGLDNSFGAWGWYLDDVSIHTCAASPAVAFTSAPQGTLIVKSSGTVFFAATGSPAPTYSLVGPLPAGVQFTGTALTGTPSSGTVGAYPLVVQANNGAVTGATQFFTLNVVRQPQLIDFPAPLPKAVKGGPFTVSVSGGPSGLPVVIGSSTPSVCSTSGSTVTPLRGGTCTVIATQPGNGDYEDAPPVTRSFQITGQPLVVDFNNDGSADLLWQSTTGRTALWLMNGVAQVGGRELFGAGTNWAPKLVGDFNGDGYADILFERSTDFATAIWTMNGSTQIGGALLLNSQTPGSAWKAKFVADFNGDGKADIVWEKDDGTIAIWLMNGTVQIGGGVILPAGYGWHVKGTADFNGDGKADLLWENVDGSSALWIMDGATQVGGGRLFAGGTGWYSVGTGDLNGDGKADILWRHTDGRSASWIMNGSVQVGGALLIGTAGTGWLPVMAGDINGDGKADIIFAKNDGTVSWWAMNGSTQIGGGSIFAAGTGYTVKRVVDFNGDGKADLLVVKSNGDTSMGVFNGTTFDMTVLLAGTYLYAPIVAPE